MRATSRVDSLGKIPRLRPYVRLQYQRVSVRLMLNKMLAPPSPGLRIHPPSCWRHPLIRRAFVEHALVGHRCTPVWQLGRGSSGCNRRGGAFGGGDCGRSESRRNRRGGDVLAEARGNGAGARSNDHGPGPTRRLSLGLANWAGPDACLFESSPSIELVESLMLRRHSREANSMQLH